MKKKTALFLSMIIAVSVLFGGCGESLGVGNAEIKYKIDEGSATVRELPNKTSITEIIIPDTVEGVPVTEIADFAGCNLESTRKITIGKNVKEIGVWAFENNQSLKEFAVDPENEHFCTVDGVLYTKDMKTLLFYPPAAKTEYEIPEGVEVIRSKAFYKCDQIKSVTLPSTLRRIEEKAFFKCSSLEKITLPQKLKSIGMDAFGYCTEIKEIAVPEGVTEIGDYAFYNCTSLLSVTMQCKKENVKFGEKWQPTNNGIEIKELKIIWE